MEVQKNQQDQTTMVLDNKRIRGRHEHKPCLQCAHLTTKNVLTSFSAILPSTHLPGVSPSSTLPGNLWLNPGYIFLLLRDGLMSLYRVPYNPDIAFTKTWIWILTLQLMIGWNWFIVFLCLSFSICKMGLLMYPHLTARRRKYVKHLALCWLVEGFTW